MAKSKAELQAENTGLRKTNQYTMVIEVFRPFIKWAAILVIAYLLYESKFEIVQVVALLAGKKTEVSFGDTSGEQSLSLSAIAMIFSVLSAIAGASYGRAQKLLRMREIKRVSVRIKELELLLDSKRQSSGIHDDGSTNPKDK